VARFGPGSFRTGLVSVLKLADRDAEIRARMDATEQPRRLLGLLMFEMGLISQEQLVQALDAQRRSGELLGEVVIRLGFATRLAIQDALAKQSGVLLRPEAGFGGGLRCELVRREGRRESAVDQQPVELREIKSRGTDVPEAAPIASRHREPQVRQPDKTWPEPELKKELRRLSAEVGRHAQRLEELEGELERARHALTMARRGTPPRNSWAIPVEADEACLADDRSEPFLAIVGRARKHITARRTALHQQNAVTTRP
jgi:hypothetical protein